MSELRIGVPAESGPGESRVAATPATVAQLIKLGYAVSVQSGAGAHANFPDEAYRAAGAELGSAAQAWGADAVIHVREPEEVELEAMRPGAYLACLLAPARSPELIERLAARGVTALALDAVPRLSRAQALDVLSSMANLGGYRAVIEAAHAYGALFGGQVTAAGKVPPAEVFVVGAGVAGLAAIGAASSLGARVRAFDVRPEVAEQIESLGAEVVTFDAGAEPGATDGYARELSADAARRGAALYAEETARADVVITTALIPGRPAPELITADMVKAMRPGSVIVDMAAATGGNCALTVAGQSIVSDNGVRVIGYTDLPGRLPTQASQLFGTNVVNLFKLLTPAGDGVPVLDFDDEVLRAMTVVRDGEVTWPPPPVSVSAAPSSTPDPDRAPIPQPTARRPSRLRRGGLLGLAAALFVLMAAFSPPAVLGHFTVLALAIVLGYYVISNVTHALHTPLMAQTNAISGIILVGALLQIGDANPFVTVVSFLAIVVASINIFGGFLVTNRMLRMFQKG